MKEEKRNILKNCITSNVFIILMILLFITTYFVIAKKIELNAQQETKNSLTTVLVTSQQALSSWRKNLIATTKVWANSKSIKRATIELSKLPHKELKGSKWQKTIRAQLESILKIHDYRGYFIVNRKLRNLSSSRDETIDVQNILSKNKHFFETIWLGKSVTSEPIKISASKDENKIVSIFAGVPIFNKEKKVIAAFCFHVDPSLDFSKILQRGRIGSSGETYAINEQGVLASNSRFNNQLKKINLLNQKQQSILNINIVDPGKNLLEDKKIDTQNSLALTLMANSVIHSKNRTSIDSNLKGYRDYRGVPVVGAWVWDSELNIGITTEIDVDEAYFSLNKNKAIIKILVSLSCCLLISILYVFQKNNKWLRKIIQTKTKELEEKQGQLIQSAKLASLGELSSGLGHELNNPLTFVMGFNNRIKKKLLENKEINREQILDYVEDISQGTSRMRKIIDHVRDFSRISEHNLEVVNVNEVIKSSLLLIQQQYDLNSIELKVKLSSKDLLVLGDKIRLEQVFVNLLTNASDALEELPNQKSKIVSITTQKEKNHIIIKFSDNGPGISKENIETIFDPFFTTKEVGKGTGLGLSISHGIIAEHDGEITATSNNEIGTSFTIRLPLHNLKKTTNITKII